MPSLEDILGDDHLPDQLLDLEDVGAGAGQLYLAPATARLFANAEQIAQKAGDSFVTAERLLLAMYTMISPLRCDFNRVRIYRGNGARKAGGKGVDSRARSINRGGTTGAASLAFAGIFATGDPDTAGEVGRRACRPAGCHRHRLEHSAIGNLWRTPKSAGGTAQ